MVTADSSGGWTRFTFTEVPNSSSSKLQNTKSSVKYENEIFGSENSIAIYPNPVSNILTINVSSSNFNQYTIFDISGRVSLKGKFVKGTVVQDINVSDLSKGIYIISLSSDETNKVFKWVKN